jgi:arylsulfatase A-like enzyme
VGRPLKYIWDLDDQTELLFDLVGDPDELSDVSAEHPDLVSQARKMVTPDAERLKLEAVEIDRATQAGLEALGYID